MRKQTLVNPAFVLEAGLARKGAVPDSYVCGAFQFGESHLKAPLEMRAVREAGRFKACRRGRGGTKA